MILLIALLAGVFALSGCLSETPPEETKLSCETDSDCIPGGECCHPDSCVNKEWHQKFYQSNCEGAICTMVCMACPSCECVNNQCTKTGITTKGDCC